MGGYVFWSKPFWKTRLGGFLTQKRSSIRDVNKIDFIMISVNVQVTFKSVKIMHLNCYFSYWPHPYKTRHRNTPSWAYFNQYYIKACVNGNWIDLFMV